ncbi:MAG TPA: 50S ribosomal protein L30 [Vicinamibacteria bacterium]|jgi:large subunit ribosomal protein L30
MAESKKKMSDRQTKKPEATTKKTPAKAATKKATAPKSAKPPKPGQPALAAEPVVPREKDAPREKREPAARRTAPGGDLSGMIRVKLVRSLIGSTPHQRAVVAGLGLRRMNQTVERKDTREIRGMVAQVPHLVSILG